MAFTAPSAAVVAAQLKTLLDELNVAFHERYEVLNSGFGMPEITGAHLLSPVGYGRFFNTYRNRVETLITPGGIQYDDCFVKDDYSEWANVEEVLAAAGYPGGWDSDALVNNGGHLVVQMQDVLGELKIYRTNIDMVDDVGGYEDWDSLINARAGQYRSTFIGPVAPCDIVWAMAAYGTDPGGDSRFHYPTYFNDPPGWLPVSPFWFHGPADSGDHNILGYMAGWHGSPSLYTSNAACYHDGNTVHFDLTRYKGTLKKWRRGYYGDVSNYVGGAITFTDDLGYAGTVSAAWIVQNLEATTGLTLGAPFDFNFVITSAVPANPFTKDGLGYLTKGDNNPPENYLVLVKSRALFAFRLPSWENGGGTYYSDIWIDITDGGVTYG